MIYVVENWGFPLPKVLIISVLSTYWRFSDLQFHYLDNELVMPTS